MRQLYLLAAFAVLSLSASAQTNYKPGYLVNLSGDTTRGYINYREWNSNPSGIDFKNSLTDNDRKKISPADVAGFGITGLATYKTYNGPMSVDDVNGNGVSNARDTSFVIGNFFLKALQNGKVLTLYSFQDNIKTRYFISEGQQAPAELRYHVYYTQENSTITESTYKKQLSTIAGKHNMLDDKLNNYIQRSEYNYSNMLSIVSMLNDIKVVKEDNVIAANYFYAGIGTNITSFKVGGEYANAGGKAYTSILPKITGGFNLYANPNTQKLALRVELGIGANRYESNYKNLVFPYNDVAFHFTQIIYSVTPEILYNIYNAPDLKFYTAIGFQLSYSQYLNKAFTNKDGSAFSSFQGIPFYFRSVMNNFVFKAGFAINKNIDVYVDYIPRADLNKDPYFVIYNTILQAGVNYSFK